MRSPFGVGFTLWALIASPLSVGFAQDTDPPVHVASSDGMAGIIRVALPSEEPGLTVAASSGYGFVEERTPGTGDHHRLRGVVSASVQATSWLGFFLGFDGRFDLHPGELGGSDTTGYGAPRLGARVGTRVGESVLLGLDLVADVAGGDFPSIDLGATSLIAKGLFGFAPAAEDWVVAANFGYRLDRSAEAAGDRSRLRAGELLTLGASDFNSLLLGVGASYRFGALDLLAELSWDLLVGSGAPPTDESPLRFGLGARYALSESVGLELSTETRLMGAHGLSSTGPLVPAEPRFAVMAGVRYFLPFGRPEPIETETVTPGATITAQPVPVETSAVRGVVLDSEGQPVEGARVKLRQGELTREAITDATGAYEIDGVPAGEASVTVASEGFQQTEFPIRIPPSQPPETRLAILPGQLRGLIRSFDGTPLAATVRVAPGDHVVEANSRGEFEIDLPTGEYDVTVEAPRYQSQQRSVSIERNGVTILNVDLRRGR